MRAVSRARSIVCVCVSVVRVLSASQLMDDREGDLHLKNLRVYEATTEQEALNLLFLGNVNRVTSETPMNLVRHVKLSGHSDACRDSVWCMCMCLWHCQASSRSHGIFTITLECRPQGSEVIRTSKLHLVRDLSIG
jgi:kinesin family protein 6/9